MVKAYLHDGGLGVADDGRDGPLADDERLLQEAGGVAAHVLGDLLLHQRGPARVQHLHHTSAGDRRERCQRSQGHITLQWEEGGIVGVCREWWSGPECFIG